MKTLKDLSVEYTNAIKAMEDVSAKTRNEIKKAKAEFDSDRVKSLSYKLAMIYEEIRDMKIVAEKLKSYYDSDLSVMEAAG